MERAPLHRGDRVVAGQDHPSTGAQPGADTADPGAITIKEKPANA